MALMKRIEVMARIAFALGILLAGSGAAHAQTMADVSGRYDCAPMRLAGKNVACIAAMLDLKNDGSFEVRGREGSYLVKGEWVELNGSVLKSRAKIEAGHKIVFRYHTKKGLCEITFERRVAELGKRALG